MFSNLNLFEKMSKTFPNELQSFLAIVINNPNIFIWPSGQVMAVVATLFCSQHIYEHFKNVINFIIFTAV